MLTEPALSVAGSPDPQELEVMRLIVAGYKDKAIARRLGISIVTVRRRAQRFRKRVGAKTRYQAVAIAAQRGWLDPESIPRSGSESEEGEVP